MTNKKNESGLKIFKAGIVLILIAISSLFLASCSNRDKTLSKDEARNHIEKTLNEKYGKDFNIISLDRENAGVLFSEYYYEAKMEESGTGEEFEAAMDLDGSFLMDNYEKNVYVHNIEEKLSEMLANIPDIEIIKKEIRYHMTQTVSSDVNDYMQKNHPTAWLDITPAGNNYEIQNLEEEICSMLEKLAENEFYYEIILTVNGKEVHFVHSETVPESSREEIIRKVEKTL